jgi:hypothetical protein
MKRQTLGDFYQSEPLVIPEQNDKPLASREAATGFSKAVFGHCFISAAPESGIDFSNAGIVGQICWPIEVFKAVPLECFAVYCAATNDYS